ncbi:MAG: hypothetical protein WC829_06300 [Hyphomicrobium sp.]|jgi:hypothetical protein
MMRLLLVYHYFEKNAGYKDNLLHYLRFGYDPDADNIIVISGAHSVDLPELPNLRYVHTDNRNYDYGGHVAALRSVGDVDVYDAFLFVNSSVRGPYLPPYAAVPWHRYFTNLFADDVGLVGSSINILGDGTSEARNYREEYGGDGPLAHVQTMAYAMPAKTMRHLLAKGFYDNSSLLTRDQIIRDYELRLSQLVLAEGWNLKSLLPEYNRLDYRSAFVPCNATSRGGDPCYPYGYLGRTPHPYETMFVKTERRLFAPQYLDRLSASMDAVGSGSHATDASPAMQCFLARLRSGNAAKMVLAQPEPTGLLGAALRAWRKAGRVRRRVSRPLRRLTRG